MYHLFILYTKIQTAHDSIYFKVLQSEDLFFINISLKILQLLPEYQVAHERAVYKAIAIVADTKKVIQNMDIEKLSELRGMNKPILDIEDLMTAIIMICESDQ